MPKTYSTPQAAKLIDVSYITLKRWLAAGKIHPHGIKLPDGRTLWQWTDADIRQGRKVKATQRPGRKPASK